MSQPHLQLKIEVFHKVRNHSKDVSSIEKQLSDLLPKPAVNASIENVRISVGYEASVVFVEFEAGRWYTHRFEKVAKSAGRWLDDLNYADDIRVRRTWVKAVEGNT